MLKYVQVVDFVYTDVIYAWGKRLDIGQMRCDYASQTATQQSAFVISGACHQQAFHKSAAQLVLEPRHTGSFCQAHTRA